MFFRRLSGFSSKNQMNLFRFLLIGLCCLSLPFTSCRKNNQKINEINVYAASSLTEAFQKMKVVFEALYPGSTVRLTFAGSQVLRLQIQQGASADIFVSANQAHVKALSKAGRVKKSQIFAKNDLVLITPLQNPSKLRSFGDLLKAKRLVIGSEQVPIGLYTRKLLEKVESTGSKDFAKRALHQVVSKEKNVRLVRAKVELGEADAAIVYKTDALASKRVKRFIIPKKWAVSAFYSIGLLKSGQKQPLAQKWFNFLVSSKGRSILSSFGFVVP